MKVKKPNRRTFPLKCQLENDKICDNCCECFVCDLNPEKICDNCAECLNLPDYNSVVIDDILLLEETPGKKRKRG